MYCDFASVHKYGSGYDYILRFCLSYIMRLEFQHTSGHEYVSVILVVPYAFQDLIMRPVKRLLDMHPSMSKFRQLSYCMNSSML